VIDSYLMVNGCAYPGSTIHSIPKLITTVLLYISNIQSYLISVFAYWWLFPVTVLAWALLGVCLRLHSIQRRLHQA